MDPTKKETPFTGSGCPPTYSTDCPLYQILGQDPINYALEVIGGKWNIRIIYELLQQPVMRYGELKRALPGITHKMLSSQLKGLVQYEIVCRKEYPQVPPKVEYSLTDRGQGLAPVFDLIGRWIESFVINTPASEKPE